MTQHEGTGGPTVENNLPRFVYLFVYLLFVCVASFVYVAGWRGPFLVRGRFRLKTFPVLYGTIPNPQ